MTVDETAVDENRDEDQPAAAQPTVTKPTARSFSTFAAVAMTLSVVAALALLGWVVYFVYEPDRELDDAASRAAVAAAKEGTSAVLSYSPDTIDHDLATAKSHLTGNFLKSYTDFTDHVIRPAVKDKAVKTTAVVLRAALSEFHPDSAVALVFVNQSTASRDQPEPTFANSSVTVSLAKVDGKWLISDFIPL